MPWIKHLFTIFVLFTLQSAFAQWGEGWDPVDPPVPSDAEAGKVEVVEFFWYGCPHCYHLEPEMKAWLSKQDNVDFRRIPVPLNPKWAVHSHFYYAAQALGVLDKLHMPLFDAMHEQRRDLFDKESLIDFAAEQGVDSKALSDAWDSFSVFVKVQQARKLGDRFQLTGVPAIGINGKYKTSATLAGSTDQMFQVMNELVAKESKTASANP